MPTILSSSRYFPSSLVYSVCIHVLYQMRQERWDGIASKHRDDSVEDNLKHFEEMKKGTNEGVRWCIRAKISVDNPNKALRDPVIYRCNLLPHHRTGDKWKIYPTYDFACPIVDSLEGVTHALRTNEYRDRNPQYYWMIEALSLRPVFIWDFRYNAFCQIQKHTYLTITLVVLTSSIHCFRSASFTGS